MKVFEVVTEHWDGDTAVNETQFVTSEKDSLKSVTDHFTIHCFEYDKELKSVREVLTIVEHIE